MAAGLRVALIAGSVGGVGGTEGQAAHLAAGLVAGGHEVVVYCEAGVAIPGVTLRRVLPRARGALGVARVARAVQDLDLGGFDVVQSFIRVPRATVHRAGGGAHRAWLRARGGWPGFLDLATLHAERLAVRDARVVVCNSERAACDVRTAHGIAPGRVRVIRNAVDLARFRPDVARRAAARAAWDVPAGGRVALFVGNGFRRKGLAVAVAAFARASVARDRLVVMGGDARAARRLAAARRVLGDRLVALGPRPDPWAWMPGADATLLPTLYDPSANATLEALACDVAPVTSGRDGASEVVPRRALVVDDPSDVAGFAEALDAAWGLSRSGEWRAAASRWPVSRMTEQVVDLYRELSDG